MIRVCTGACRSSSNFLKPREGLVKSFFIFIFITLLLCCTLFAESEIAGYPIFGYENETGFYAGGIAYARNRPKHFDTSIPPNSYYLSLEYSAKKQFAVKFEPELHFKNGLYTFSPKLNFKKWPSKFYGIGKNAALDMAEDFTPIEFECTLDLSRRVSADWDLSLIYDFSHYEITKKENGGILSSGTIPGSKGGFNSGLGLQISYDSRNAETYPAKGALCSFRAMNYNKIIGSDYNFDEYTLDLRQYLSFSDKHVFALQGYVSFTSKNPPFYSMPHLDKHMRGMTPNLHIDKQIAVFRAEYRVFPWEKGFLNRLGFVVFAENGQVADKPKNLSLAHARSDLGFGLRYSFFTDDRLNLRIDIGFGEEDWNFSISTGEAF